MADTISDLSGINITEALGATWDLILADLGLRGAFHLHPAVAAGYAGNGNGSNSLTTKSPRVRWGGADPLVARTEDEGGSPTALVTGSAALVEGPQYFEYATTQEAQAKLQILSELLATPTEFVMEAMRKYDLRLFNMHAALSGGFTGNAVNSTGVKLSLDDIFEASSKLDAAQASGPRVLITSPGPNGWGAVQEELRSESGTIFSRDTNTMSLIANIGNYKGTIAGIDVLTSSSLATTGGDTYSVLFAPGAYKWRDSLPIVNGANPFVNVANRVVVEQGRTPASGRNQLFFHALMGVVEGQDLAGASIRHLT
jgi:hypothetical protein